MTLDEAIKHCEEVAEKNENKAQEWHKQTKNRVVNFCEKAIQAENDCIECADEHKQLAEWLKELKQLREQTRWTPISEKLPKESGDYFTTISFDIDGKEPVREVYKDYFSVLSQKWLYHGEDVIAWKPLPEPYKAESEEI